MTLEEWFGPQPVTPPSLPACAHEITICQRSRRVIIVHRRGISEQLEGQEAEYAIQALQTGDWAPKKNRSNNGSTQYWTNR